MIKRIFWCLLVCLFISQPVMAFTNSELKSIYGDYVYYSSQDTDTECASSSPGNPRFPSGVDEAALSNKIDGYISQTRPDSPMAGTGAAIVSYGKQYNVNPVLTVALAQKETIFGTVGHGTAPEYNIFDIRNGPGGSFGSYPSVDAAIKAVNELLAGPLYLGSPANLTTITEIMYKYAPPADRNDTAGYIKFIAEIYQKISTGLDIGGGEAQPSGCVSSHGSGVVNAEGYAFPVAPQTQSGNSKVPGLSALPCLSSSCHHDGTAAFDIGRQPGGDVIAGTPVYAISEGTTDDVHIYKGIEGCYSLQLHSSKDNTWYWYGHLQNPTVKTGDTVKSGQQLAEIGVRKCTGNGSTPHLHIDRGCIINGVPQKGGRIECRDPDFVPFMNRLFNSLPA